MARGITFDFHNTIAACDAWFQLEVRRLVSAFLEWEASSNGTRRGAALAAAADAEYRRLRQAIHVHGHELPAERCVAAVLGRLGIHLDSSEIARGVDELMRKVLPHATPMIGALETVRVLAGNGVALGIVSIEIILRNVLAWERLSASLPGERCAVVTE